MCLSSSSSSLIVDFPRYPRQAATAASKKKTVRFAEHGQLWMIKPYSDFIDDPSQLWYSSNDDELSSLSQQAFESKRALAATDLKEDIITEDKICLCAGLESVITRTNAWRVRNHRRQHMDTIVSRQDMCSPETLSLMSMQSSRHACKRAHKLAVIYFKTTLSAVRLGISDAPSI